MRVIETRLFACKANVLPLSLHPHLISTPHCLKDGLFYPQINVDTQQFGESSIPCYLNNGALSRPFLLFSGGSMWNLTTPATVFITGPYPVLYWAGYFTLVHCWPINGGVCETRTHLSFRARESSLPWAYPILNFCNVGPHIPATLPDATSRPLLIGNWPLSSLVDHVDYDTTTSCLRGKHSSSELMVLITFSIKIILSL